MANLKRRKKSEIFFSFYLNSLYYILVAITTMKCKVTRKQTCTCVNTTELLSTQTSYYLAEHSNCFSSEQQLRAFEEYKLVLQIAADDGLSQYMCQKCKLRLLSLERSLEDLSNFRQLVRSSQSKRTKRNIPQAALVNLLTLKDSNKAVKNRLSSESNIFTNEINK